MGAHRRRGVGTAPLVLRLGKTNVQVSGGAGEAPHHAAVRSARIDDALPREHGELAGTDGINVDHKRAADLLAVLGQEGLHTRVAEAAGAQANKPDVVAEKRVVVHGQYGVAQVVVGGRGGVGIHGLLAGGGVGGGIIGCAGIARGSALGLVLDEPQAGAGGGAALPAAILVAPVLVVGDAEPVLALVVGLGGALVTKRQVDLGQLEAAKAVLALGRFALGSVKAAGGDGAKGLRGGCGLLRHGGRSGHCGRATDRGRLSGSLGHNLAARVRGKRVHGLLARVGQVKQGGATRGVGGLRAEAGVAPLRVLGSGRTLALRGSRGLGGVGVAHGGEARGVAVAGLRGLDVRDEVEAAGGREVLARHDGNLCRGA